MITLSEKSWHCRLVRTVLENGPRRNLCPYIRQVILALLISTMAVLVLSSVAATAVCPVLLLFGVQPPEAMLIGSFIIWTFAIIGVCVEAGYRILKLYRNRKYRYEEKEPSLARLWLQDKHDKICSEIQFKA
jgi:hypothetical protein